MARNPSSLAGYVFLVAGSGSIDVDVANSWVIVVSQPGVVFVDGGIGIEVDRYRIGIVGSNLLTVEGETLIETVRNPIESVPRAAGLTLEIPCSKPKITLPLSSWRS